MSTVSAVLAGLALVAPGVARERGRAGVLKADGRCGDAVGKLQRPSQPVLPSALARAASVLGPSTPSAVSPEAAWNAFSARMVAGPY